MTKYLVSYSETNLYSVIVEADSREEAENKAEQEVMKGLGNLTYVQSDSFFQCEGEV